jgi:integrase
VPTGDGYWCVEFYDFTADSPRLDDAGLEGLGALHDRAIRNGARHGTPVIVGRDGGVDPRLNLFFRSGRMTSCRPRTWRRYAFALTVWLDFLHVLERRWDQATPGDVEDFKDWRISDLRNPGRVSPTSFDTDRAALSAFYGWASSRYPVRNPVPSAGRGRSVRTASGADVAWARGQRDPLRPAGAKRRQVKWMERGAFEQWRDIGLRGYGFDGVRRAGWRGANEDRDAAFVDGLWGTGLRLAEWASVLDVEIPQPGGERFAKTWLSAACIKGGGQGRTYRIPRSVLGSIAAYCDPLEGSRVEAVRRARAAGRYERVAGRRTAVGYDPRGRVLMVEGRAGLERLSLDAVGPDERRLLYWSTPEGLTPLALWLTPAGIPKRAHGWEDTFQAANARIAALWARAGESDPGAVDPAAPSRQWCPLWARPHMLRHSFALKWYSILSLAWQQRIDGFDDDEARDLRELFGDIWYQMAALLGHRDPMTTREIYLEPFTALELDYLMALLDGEESAAVDAMVRALGVDSGRVLASARPGAGR